MLFVILTIITYVAAILWIAPTIIKTNTNKPNTTVILGFGILAVLLHFITLSNQLSTMFGFRLTIINVVSFICLLMSLMMTFAITKWKTSLLPLLVIYILSIVSVALSGVITGETAKYFSQNISLLFHISIAMLSYAMFFIALLYVFQLKWIDIKLKNKQLSFNSHLPPLMTVERHLFSLTFIAQVLLTLTLITGIIYLPQVFSNNQIHKTVFSFMAWIIYAMLLFGQWKLHWRGKRVLIYSISGMILLTVGYFGSRI
ncbi:cytochrome C assembly family protein [Pasteurella atlantica]|uniref:cytochrome C assembly family protein n=1 Tax=Pasteurellaceae TaxID=712 RepID=UPI0027661A4C|nr:cytochrome c biogenesis protein CcsA [Pasteurella atlantica]MDP8098621.1 cytochrome c biogenesis protein CcsA [Pasteurella atlantica]MDP8101034.1 cytochrome c biogenesis protein CcsA [Pasteurella atlantica]MDP8106687.1 cytochrome c biogenesis protein CcsA [Pasteurella atlantica]MDP8116378.1 cytochrome c biogenesis protein CcsA [Pasteurella atlantica]